MPLYFQLLSPSEVDREGSRAARDVLRWVREYLGAERAEPRLPRKFVCPFIPAALAAQTLFIAVAPDVVDAKGTEEAMEYFRQKFHEIEPKAGPEVRYKTIIVVFPDLPEANVNDAIDGVQRKLKASFVQKSHLMIGELHPRNMTEAAGHTGEGIYPNRTPLPVLAIRVIVAPDLKKFLVPDNGPEHAEEDYILFTRYQIAYYEALLLFYPRTAPTRTLWQTVLEEQKELLQKLEEASR
jgi:hypothetical protein